MEMIFSLFSVSVFRLPYFLWHSGKSLSTILYSPLSWCHAIFEAMRKCYPLFSVSDFRKATGSSVKLDYTCRARWPEGLLCVRSHIVQIECARKLQPVSRILHLKYGRQKSKITLFRSHIVQKCTDGRTHGHTDTIHTSFSLTLSVVREHNSPSGNTLVLFVLIFEKESWH